MGAGNRGRVSAAWALCLAFAPAAFAQEQPVAPRPDPYLGKTRIFVLSDMGNEPDDQMSFVRLMLYANELDIEGLSATTSTWLRGEVHPETMHAIIDAYGAARPNLLRHAPGWPSAEALHRLVSTGPSAYGMAAVDPDAPSPAARALIAAADRADERPLWVSVWGGASTLAEALEVVRRTRSAEATSAFVARLRVYAISDQDDAGVWIRREFPKLFYVVSPSSPDSSDYAASTWSGISGDFRYANSEGADPTKITNAWLDANIRQGPLGALYPRWKFIMEGDTPAFLGLTQNGLAGAQSPAWGGWGGRYVYRLHPGAAGPIWSQGGTIRYGVNSRDRVTGLDGREHLSDQATIWRWRDAFQNDFTARIAWTVKSPDQANHHPLAVVNGDEGKGPIFIRARFGEAVALDASASRDPDKGQRLSYRWFSYPEAGATLDALADVEVAGGEGARASVVARGCRPASWTSKAPCRSGVAHVILEVRDDGAPALVSYRRVIMQFDTPD